MLELIVGRAGVGKSEQVLIRIQEELARGAPRAILIVPEQFSFETERALYQRLGARDMLRVEVLSFKRLAQTVFRAYGGLAGEYLDASAKSILMNMCLFELEGTLNVYAGYASGKTFTKTMCAMISALKNGGMTPDALRSASVRLEENGGSGTLLCEKMKELSLIFQAFEAYVAGGYADEDDDLTRAFKMCEEHRFFDGLPVFLDEFAGFTVQEKRMVETILSQASLTCVALCCGADAGGSLFEPVRGTMRWLTRTARQYGRTVAPPRELLQAHRFASPSLAALEQNLFSPRKEAFEGTCDGVFLSRPAGLSEEIREVCAGICRLVREEGYRYRDIAILSREPEKYRMFLERSFSDFGIPYFLDKKYDVLSSPIAGYLTALFDCVRGGFSTSDILRLAKSPLMGNDPAQTALLENYVYVWEIRGRSWLSPFVSHPSGYLSEFTDTDRQTLIEVNALREQVVEPVLRLREQLAQGSAEELARSLYGFLQEQGILPAMREMVARLREAGEETLAEDQEEVWKVILGILDAIAVSLRGRQMGFDRFYELFTAALVSAEIGKIPEHTDEVLVGDVSRTQSGERRIAFVIGVNEGVFPMGTASGGVFTDRDARVLKEMGFEFVKTGEDVQLDERLSAYRALTSVRERVFLSSPRHDLRGQELAESVVVREIRAIFPSLRETWGLASDDALYTEKNMQDAYLSHFQGRDVLFSTLDRFFKEDQARRELLRRAVTPLSPRLNDPSIAHALYGRRMQISPSRVEDFHRCPFYYYLSHGLRLRALKKAQLSPIETGSVIHYALEELVAQYGGRGLCGVPDSQLWEDIGRLLDRYLHDNMGGLADKPARFQYLFSRLSDTVFRLIRHLAEEFAQSEFEPADFELAIEEGSEVPPVELQTATGETVLVIGRIDRVDTCRKDGKTYVRVVDYKTGSRKFSLSDVFYGLNLQMLIYLFSIWRNGSGPYDGVFPAGVLYLPAKNPVATIRRGADEKAVRAGRRSQLKMSGLVLDDPAVIRAMEQDAGGVFIPAKLKKDNTPDYTSTVASLAQMGRLSRYIDHLIVDMAEELLGGKMDIRPISKNGALPCDYCDFRAICHVHPQEQAFEQENIRDLFDRLDEGESTQEEENHGLSLD